VGNFGGFYKGEKKKSKKGQEPKQNLGVPAPTFSMPEIIKKKKEES